MSDFPEKSVLKEGVWFNVISITQEWVSNYQNKALHYTAVLEWPFGLYSKSVFFLCHFLISILSDSLDNASSAFHRHLPGNVVL